MPAIFAANHVAVEVDGSPVDLQMFSLDEELGHLFSGTFHQPREGGAGNSHFSGGFVVVFAQVIRQANRLEFVQGQRELFQESGSHSRGFESGMKGWAVHEPLFLGSGQLVSFDFDVHKLCT